jgi:hypothetical protein
VEPGLIDLNVPVSGSLQSPKFSFAEVVAGAFRQSLSRAATAPFSLLGSVFNAPPDIDLSLADYRPGAAELTDETQNKLKILASESPASRERLRTRPSRRARAAFTSRSKRPPARSLPPTVRGKAA